MSGSNFGISDWDDEVNGLINPSLIGSGQDDVQFLYDPTSTSGDLMRRFNIKYHLGGAIDITELFYDDITGMWH